MESPLIALLLDPAVSWDNFRGWLDDSDASVRLDGRNPEADGDNTAEHAPALDTPAIVSSRFSSADLKLMRPEIGLAVINFIRDQIAPILEESLNGLPTPAKAANATATTPAAKKYDYRSPVKSLGIGGKVAGSKNYRGGRTQGSGKDRGGGSNNNDQRSSNAGGKRAQLFKADKDAGGQLAFMANNSCALLGMPENQAINALEERCNGPRRSLGGAGGEANFQPGKNFNHRRSLGPEFERTNAGGKGRTPSLTYNLSDFLTPPAKTIKQKKKNRKSPAVHHEAESQPHDTHSLKARKTKSLSPTAVVRAATAGCEVKVENDETIVPDSSQGDGKVTAKEYKAKFANANIWTQIVREFDGEQGEFSSKREFSSDPKNQSSKSIPPATMQSSDDALVIADPALVTNKAELDK